MLCSVRDADIEEYVTSSYFKVDYINEDTPCVGFYKIIHYWVSYFALFRLMKYIYPYVQYYNVISLLPHCCVV
jgi:hypothetical protein